VLSHTTLKSLSQLSRKRESGTFHDEIEVVFPNGVLHQDITNHTTN
jgi:hypothetical protein